MVGEKIMVNLDDLNEDESPVIEWPEGEVVHEPWLKDLKTKLRILHSQFERGLNRLSHFADTKEEEAQMRQILHNSLEFGRLVRKAFTDEIIIDVKHMKKKHKKACFNDQERLL